MDESEVREQERHDRMMARQAAEKARLEWLLQAAERSGHLRKYVVAHELPNGGWAAFSGLKPIGWGETREAAIDAAICATTERKAQ